MDERDGGAESLGMGSGLLDWGIRARGGGVGEALEGWSGGQRSVVGEGVGVL